MISYFSIYKPCFFGVSKHYYSNNVKLLPLSNNKVSLAEKQIISKGMLTNNNQ